MGLKIDSAELETANDLLKDFAANPALSAEEVYRTSWIRFNYLEQALLDILLDTRKYERINYVILPIVFHKFMYDGLYTFAGKYRQKDDPENGNIYFGKQHAQRRKPLFYGDHPDQIEEGIKVAVSYLESKSKDPLYNAMHFYQKFVFVHPFYDANGRIGRLIANMYLNLHNLSLAWSEFDSKSKFIKKLNRCHHKPDEENFRYLILYVKNFTLSMNKLDR